MEDNYNPYSRDLRAFRRHYRQPSSDSSSKDCLNVYSHSRTISNTSSANLSLQTILVQSLKPSRSFHTSSTESNPSFKSTKSLKLSKPIQIKPSPKPPVVPVSSKKPLKMQSLTQQTTKESILFNQVKNLSTSHKSKKAEAVNVLALNYSEKMIKISHLRKMSTIKRLMLSTESEVPAEVAKEAETIVLPAPKRKQLKQHRWRWVGAGGNEVY